jgi:hypothetical protein
MMTEKLFFYIKFANFYQLKLKMNLTSVQPACWEKGLKAPPPHPPAPPHFKQRV